MQEFLCRFDDRQIQSHARACRFIDDAKDGSVSRIWLEDPTGKVIASSKPEDVGRDAAGLSGTNTLTVTIFDPSDVEAPFVEITSPDETTSITAPIDVRGTATDTNLVSWTPISTNLMPATQCPICPYILVRV